MGIDIGIGDGLSFSPCANEPHFALADDGYYWYLHPLFEDLRTATGQYIDLYGDASSSSNDLGALANTLKGMRKLIETQPERWEVCTGQELVPYQRKTRSRGHMKAMFAAVEKCQFLLLMDQWETVVARANELNRPVVCFGD